MIDEIYKNDPNRLNSYESFEHSLTEDNKDVVSMTKSSFVIRIRYPGIFPFIQMQREWVVRQLNAWERGCIIQDNGLYNLTVFPNPAKGSINIVNETSFEFAQFKLYDFTGKLCMETAFDIMSGPSANLQLTGIPPGIYLLLKRSGDNRIGRAKIIIE